MAKKKMMKKSKTMDKVVRPMGLRQSGKKHGTKSKKGQMAIIHKGKKVYG